MRQILVFILFSALFCWLMFSPVYRHVLIVRQAVLQKEVDYLLEVGANASHGYIGAGMIADSRTRMADRGFDPNELIYDVQSTGGAAGTDPYSRVPRGEGLILEIRYPYQQLFALDRLIGISAPASSSYMGARGIRMSEYVPEN